MSEDMRAAFERWITSPPYERILSRYTAAQAWPGHYKVYEVQLAWEAWQESAKRFESAAGFVRQGGTLHVYRTAESLRQQILLDDWSEVCWLDRVVLHE